MKIITDTHLSNTDILPPVPPYQSNGPHPIYHITDSPAILETNNLNVHPPNTW